MCGVCGFLDVDSGLSRRRYEGLLTAMNNALLHRGPDGAGRWIDLDSGVALGHRRLAVIDVSDQGAQPMRSRDGRCILSYNGEIYNYKAIRSELSSLGHRFRGDSDTEVLVEALAHWGLDATLPRLSGIFAFALWETTAGRLSLVRDPFGVKPMYWGLVRGQLLFGSELKALRAFPFWHPELDPVALLDFLRQGYIAAPATIYQGIRKLPPGCWMQWDRAVGIREQRYWDLGVSAASAGEEQSHADPTAAVDHLHDLLFDAVGAQLVADVPLGAFLSGGVDSSAVVALMQAQSGRPVKTYSVGFRDEGYDESAAARAVARRLGTDHHEFFADDADLAGLVPNLADIFDEPFADASQLPMVLVARLARESVAVALSGDGGDELFAGYNRHQWVQHWWPRLRQLPPALRRQLAHMLSIPSDRQWRIAMRLLPAKLRLPQLASKAHKLAGTLSQPDLPSAYQQLLSHWDHPEQIVNAQVTACAGMFNERAFILGPAAEISRPLLQLQLADAAGYLPDDVLTKVDRASMACGLEARVPLLDSRVAAFALSLPDSLKIRGSTGKWLLREVLRRYLPDTLSGRPKMGFSVPLDRWLRGPLRDWAESLLDPSVLADRGVLQHAEVTRLWHAHKAGATDAGQRLWNVLILQAWLDRWM